MLLARSTIPVLLAFLPVLAGSGPIQHSNPTGAESLRGANRVDTRPANCRVTLPADGVYEPPWPVWDRPPRTADDFFFGTDELWTVLPADGTWHGKVPSKAGDFAYDNKFAWYRSGAAFSPSEGTLIVSGKRLDGPALSFIETYEGIGSAGGTTPAGLVGGMSIPVGGCWEITGSYQKHELRFTVWVTTEPEATLSDLSASILPTEQQTPVAPRVHIDGETVARALAYRVLPEVPPSARAMGDTVVLHAVIGTDGRAHELSYVSGPPLLARPAMDAVVWWQYRLPVDNVWPYDPKEVDTTIAVSFSPQSK